MDYVERLIRRALAVPREHVASLFDPFEQVLPWPLDVAPTRTGRREPTDGRATPNAVMPPASSPQAVVSTETQPALTPLFAPALVERKPAPGEPLPALEHAPLARADAFMHALGVKANADIEPSRAPPAATGGECAPLAPSLAMTVRPIPPHVPAPVAATTMAPRARPSSPATDDATRASARRGPAPAAPQRIVQTVVVAPPSRRLDDLAHSSGISRFGIGQS